MTGRHNYFGPVKSRQTDIIDLLGRRLADTLILSGVGGRKAKFVLLGAQGRQTPLNL
jgi:hypothetical protein